MFVNGRSGCAAAVRAELMKQAERPLDGVRLVSDRGVTARVYTEG
jgi:hypothetical protein